MHLRDVEKKDHAQILALARQLALHVDDPPPDFPAPQFLDELFGESPSCAMLVVEDAGRLVGFAAFGRRFDVHTACPSIFLSDLVVDADMRGKGIGKRLLEGVREHARRTGAQKIYFELWERNDSARRFYAAQGALRVEDVAVCALDPGSRR
ncbi:GNAT family N-acetyltransferase [Roseobacter sp. YSTF-M11]|uniref:GNAT family N-acetyltransferase n=1 Tax=Roseobacter insulae TaxID=2859783 RepID=A0A9X1FW45_9RHOB|nr:GNAT family N-acetyltransferase [Roseobacter insulae]MBW4707963.1 GNAT family N-acetyltransferase [Roseobacter insulae]